MVAGVDYLIFVSPSREHYLREVMSGTANGPGAAALRLLMSAAEPAYGAATVLRKGRGAGDILVEALPKELNALYWAKNMYWRTGKPERFVRPVRWIVALLDDQSLPLEYAGVKAGNRSRGHRILTSSPVTVSGANEYVEELKAGKVVADPGERQDQDQEVDQQQQRAQPDAPHHSHADNL